MREHCIPVNVGIIPILHNLGDKLFNRAATDLDLSLKKVRSQKDRLNLHQKCVRAKIYIQKASERGDIVANQEHLDILSVNP
jgi:hypothetical protein